MNHHIQIVQNEDSGHYRTLFQLPTNNARDFLERPFGAAKFFKDSIAVTALTALHGTGYISSITFGETQIL